MRMQPKESPAPRAAVRRSTAVPSPNPGPALDLGTRLRSIRLLHGLSQRALARRTGVTNGIISMIEQNRSSPSVATLKKILDGFPVSLTSFFAGEEPPGDQIFFAAHELVEIAGGLLSYRQLGRNLKGKALQILHEHMHPGADTGPEMFHHDAEEGGVVIRGHVEITVGSETRVLGPGDGYCFTSRTPHRFRNAGDQVCEIVSACSPPTF